MKTLFVSLLLALLTACDLPTEPPAPKIPRAPDESGSLIIVGRVVNGAVGLQAANVRVTDAGVSVSTDETGRYRLVLPARFRGQTILVSFRAIGFSTQTWSITTASNVASVDLTVSMSMQQWGCSMGILVVTAGR